MSRTRSRICWDNPGFPVQSEAPASHSHRGGQQNEKPIARPPAAFQDSVKTQGWAVAPCPQFPHPLNGREYFSRASHPGPDK